MHLCILQSGEINPAIAEGLPGYQDMYSALFAEAAPDVHLTYIQTRHGEIPSDIDDFDAYLITGSPRGVYNDDDWIAPLHDFVRAIYRAGKPLIGICFGHQVIANALGGHAEKSSQGWGAGIRTIPVINPSDIIPADCTSLDLLYMHQDQVTSLPEGATTLMGDTFCPIAAYSIGDQVLCFQGHPEFTHPVVKAIIDLREEEIGTERSATAHDSLKKPHDGATVGHILYNFLRHSLLRRAQGQRPQN